MATFTKCDKCGKIRDEKNKKDVWTEGRISYDPSWQTGFEYLKHAGSFELCNKCSIALNNFARKFFKNKEISKV